MQKLPCKTFRFDCILFGLYVALSTFSSCLLAVTSDLEALMSAFLTVELALLPFETVLSSEARNEREKHA